MDLSDTQDVLQLWRLRNFPDADATQQLLGVSEEVGELCHSHLKEMQGIRTGENHEDNARDAVGDIVIYLMGYCSYRQWNFEDIVNDTVVHILNRDWQKDPIKGGDENS